MYQRDDRWQDSRKPPARARPKEMMCVSCMAFFVERSLRGSFEENFGRVFGSIALLALAVDERRGWEFYPSLRLSLSSYTHFLILHPSSSS